MAKFAKRSVAMDTKLLYESMASPIVDETLAVVSAGGLGLQDWALSGTYRDKINREIEMYANKGMPVTLEFHTDKDGMIEKVRERPTFEWEDSFTKNKLLWDWFTNTGAARSTARSSAEWKDGIAFNHMRPEDFTYALIEDGKEYPRYLFQPRPEQRKREVIGQLEAKRRFHHPYPRIMHQLYPYALEMEDLLLQIMPNMAVRADGDFLNLLRVDDHWLRANQRFADMGFIPDAMRVEVVGKYGDDNNKRRMLLISEHRGLDVYRLPYGYE